MSLKIRTRELEVALPILARAYRETSDPDLRTLCESLARVALFRRMHNVLDRLEREELGDELAAMLTHKTEGPTVAGPSALEQETETVTGDQPTENDAAPATLRPAPQPSQPHPPASAAHESDETSDGDARS